MNKLMRGRDRLVQSLNVRPSAIWDEIENFLNRNGMPRPFDMATNFDRRYEYLQSQERTARFELIEGHSRYQVEPTLISSSFDERAAMLGPVELDMLSFAVSPNPALAVLLGGMGTGKSTSIQYLHAEYLRDRLVLICDLESNLDTGIDESYSYTQDEVAEWVIRYINPLLNDLIDPEEEYRQMWTWALSNEAGASHPAKYILSAAQDVLRANLMNEWRSESEEAVRLRKKCREEIDKKARNSLTYQALRIDYYLTCKCQDDRSKFLLVFDNVDPLPPLAQHYLVDLALKLQKSARCKILVSVRPLTYTSNLQGANRVVEIIEHIGPSVVDLIVHRIRKTVIDADLSQLSIKVRDDSYGERVLGAEEIKFWVGEVLNTLTSEARHPSLPGDPDIKQFLEGICGYSLRSALLVAPKIFGAPAMPIIPVIAGKDSDRRSRRRVRDHELIRAVVNSWRGFFMADYRRVTDNIFDLGPSALGTSCTCKVRVLKKLVAGNNGIVKLAELRSHLLTFGYDEEVILDAINGVISQTKRLAWSDSVSRYSSLDGYQNTRIQISRAGRFYIDYALLNLDYVQGVHVDVLLDCDDTLEHDPRNFSDRLRSLELFIRYLYRKDRDEVLQVLNESGARDYNHVYNGTLFSISMILSLERQIANIGQSILSTKSASERRSDVIDTMARWRNLRAVVESENWDIIKRLVRAGE